MKSKISTENIKLHMNRCILCYRCVKVAEQITDGRVHGVLNRGDVSEISTYIEQAIDNDFSGNCFLQEDH